MKRAPARVLTLDDRERAEGARTQNATAGRVPKARGRVKVKRRWLSIGAVVALTLVATISAGCQGQTGVKTAKVTSEPLSVVVSASGKITADKKSDVFPPTQGTLTAINIKDGQVVKAGQLIASEDQDPLLVQAAQAQAGIAQGEAQKAQAYDQMPSCADINAANANVSATQFQYNLANNAYNSIFDIYKVSPPPVQKSMETTLNAAKSAKLQTYAGYRAAVATRVKLSRTSALDKSAQAGQAAVNQGVVALNLANKQIDGTEMVSPIDGYVVFNAVGVPAPDGSTPKAGVGAAVSPAAAPFTVYELSSTYFSAEVDETDIAKIKPGLKSVISLDAFAGDSFNAKVNRISPLAVLTTSGGTAFPVYIPIDGTGKPVRIGMQGNADIKISEIADAVTIPIEALFDEGGKSYVYIVGSDSKLKKTQVTVGTLTDTRAQIKSGVKVGDTVALSGTVKLTDGLAIKPQ
jgi:RND family efflux transporter MFP subunit